MSFFFVFHMPSWVSPVAQLILGILAFHVALQAPSQQSRLFLFVPFLFFTTLSFRSSIAIPFTSVSLLWTKALALNIAHVFSVLFIEKIPAPPPSASHDSLLSLKSLCATYRIWSNPRLLPKAPKITEERRGYCSTRSRFLLHCLAKLALYYSLHTQLAPFLLSAAGLTRLEPSDFAHAALFTRLGDVTARELAVRSWIAVHWILQSLVFIDGANAALALLWVGTGIDAPGDWPALFGGAGDIRGLRSFWSRFWHSLPRRPYTSFARAVVDLLGIKSGFASGVAVAFLVFLVSGLSHAAVSWQWGMQDWNDLQWFLLNFGGCFVETVLMHSLKALAVRLGLQRDLEKIQASWVGGMLGCGWVFFFFFWSVPHWKYSRLRTA